MQCDLDQDFQAVLQCKNKYKDITWNITSIYKQRPNEICKVLTAVIVEKVIPVREEEKNILYIDTVCYTYL
jgi:hypothetical protein